MLLYARYQEIIQIAFACHLVIDFLLKEINECPVYSIQCLAFKLKGEKSMKVNF